jgi:hypothetical protein
VRPRIVLFAFALAVALMGGTQARAQDASDFELLSLDHHLVKWGKPAVGAAARVSYALIDQPLSSPGAINCGALVPLNPLLQKSAITPAELQQELEAALTMWEHAADVTFVESPDPMHADILIGASALPKGPAFTNVAYDHATPAADTGARTITQSLICLDPTRQWKIGFDGDTTVYDIRYTLAHELGHSIGLDHPGPHGAVMGFDYREEFRVLQPGDVAGASTLYGAAPVPAVAATSPRNPS